MFGGQAIQGLGGAAESIAGGGFAAVNALASLVIPVIVGDSH
jgi:hypothetical protein